MCSSDLNWQLADQEYNFSYVLSEGARWVKKTLTLTSLALVSLLLFVVMLITHRIIQGIENTEKALLVSERRFRSLYQSNMLGIINWHGDGHVLDANDAFLAMLGYRRQDIETEKLNWRDLTPEGLPRLNEQALAKIPDTGVCIPTENELIHRDGHHVPVYLGAVLLDGESEQGICYSIDLTQRMQTETELRLSATVFDASSNGIMITDSDMRIIAINKAFSAMSGYQKEAILGQNSRNFCSDLMPPSLYDQMTSALLQSGQWQSDILNKKQDGSIFPVHLSISTVRDSDNEISHFVAIFTDISERKAAEEQLRKMAHYDYLTGLANRNLFNDRLNQAVQRAKRHSSLFALLFFDLDDFKPVNDKYGHDTGDKLLQITATRLLNTVRENDTVARMGGDEFVIMLEDLSTPEAASVLAKKVLAAINKPCQVNGHTIEISSSIGISIYPQDSQEVIGLTRCADIAMYAAKTEGHNCYYYYKPELDKAPL